MPEQVEVDVSNLNVHEHVSAKDVKLPDGFSILTPPDTIVVTVETSREEEAPAAVAGEAVPTVAETETPAS